MSDQSARAQGFWIWDRRLDLGVFLWPTLLAFGLVAAGRIWHISDARTPTWAWIAFVLCVDVAHVWATVYRTYFDGEELRKHPLLYCLLPLGVWALGVVVHLQSGALFWRLLAYLAVLHFIRQQSGWVAIYRAKEKGILPLDRWLENAVVYASTAVPIFLWHTRLPRPFEWFRPDDFINLKALAPLAPYAQGLLVLVWIAFLIRQGIRFSQGHAFPVGKWVVLVTTALSWYVGICVVNDDFSFTVLNVLPHGVPYFALLWKYGRAQATYRPRSLASQIVRLGILPFLLVLLAFAFGEELLWDRAIWHDRPWLFGGALDPGTHLWRSLMVPLLAIPQTTHYVLDAVIWRRSHTGPAQAKALGFG